MGKEGPKWADYEQEMNEDERSNEDEGRPACILRRPCLLYRWPSHQACALGDRCFDAPARRGPAKCLRSGFSYD